MPTALLLLFISLVAHFLQLRSYLCDFWGQDEYSIFPTQYSVDIDGYILVYSIDSEQSFEVVQVTIKQ